MIVLIIGEAQGWTKINQALPSKIGFGSFGSAYPGRKLQAIRLAI
jgi:hypothetical protein